MFYNSRRSEELSDEILKAINSINSNRSHIYPGGRDANYRNIERFVRQNPKFMSTSPETITRFVRLMAEKGRILRTSPGRFCLHENFNSNVMFTKQAIDFKMHNKDDEAIFDGL